MTERPAAPEEEMTKILDSIKGQLTELGRIKTGGLGEARTSAKGGTYRLPVKHSYFTIVGNERDSAGDLIEDAALMKRLLDAHGEDVIEKKKDAKGVVAKVKVRRLRELPIVLLSDSLDEVLLASYCVYNGKACACRCDGENATYYQTCNGGVWTMLPEPKVVPCNKEHEKPGWKLHIKLLCAISELSNRFGGFYTWRSTSEISLEQLVGGLRYIQSLTCGVLAGLPLRLVIRPVVVTPEGKPTTVYVVHVELRADDLSAVQRMALEMAQVRLRNAKELSAVGQQYRALLSAPGENETAEEAAETAAEFHPVAAGSPTPAVPVGEPEDAEFTAIEPAAAGKLVIDAQTAGGAKLKVTDAPSPAAAEARKRGRKAAGKEEPAAPPSAAPTSAQPVTPTKAPPPVAPSAEDDLADIPF